MGALHPGEGGFLIELGGSKFTQHWSLVLTLVEPRGERAAGMEHRALDLEGLRPSSLEAS